MWVAKLDRREEGDFLIRYGEKGKDFFILVEGGTNIFVPDPYWEEFKPKETKVLKEGAQSPPQQPTVAPPKYREVLH